MDSKPADCEPLLWFLDRIPGACVIGTNAHGVFTHFGPGAEAFFVCPAGEALGRMHYGAFHDPAELEACAGTAEFRAALERPGWTEDVWRVIPRVGDPFMARVTLLPVRGATPLAAPGTIHGLDNPGANGQNPIVGWWALYQRIGGAA